MGLAYTPKAVDSLAPVMREVLEDLIAGVDPHDEIDLIQAFAEPFPAQVIGRSDQASITASAPRSHVWKAKSSLRRF